MMHFSNALSSKYTLVLQILFRAIFGNVNFFCYYDGVTSQLLSCMCIEVYTFSFECYNSLSRLWICITSVISMLFLWMIVAFLFINFEWTIIAVCLKHENLNYAFNLFLNREFNFFPIFMFFSCYLRVTYFSAQPCCIVIYSVYSVRDKTYISKRQLCYLPCC